MCIAREVEVRDEVRPADFPWCLILRDASPHLHERSTLRAEQETTSELWGPSDEAVVWTIVFNLVTGNIVSPIVYGKTVHLHPAIVLVAIPAGSAIAGILGMFLVVPVLGGVAVTWRTVLWAMAYHAAGRTAPSTPSNPVPPVPSTDVAAASGAGPFPA